MKSIKGIVVSVNGLVGDVMKLHENIVREDVNPVEEAFFLRGMMKRGKLSQKDIAREIGRSEGYVSQRFEVIDGDEKVMNAVLAGKIVFSVGRELNRIKDEDVRWNYLHHAITGGASPSVVKQWVEDYQRAEESSRRYGGGPGSAAEVTPPAELKLECAVCGKAKKVSEEKMVRICNDCFVEMKL